MLHPNRLAAFRSKATEILCRGAAGGGKSHLSAAAAISGNMVETASSSV
jgi:DNA replication protein DnaC